MNKTKSPKQFPSISRVITEEFAPLIYGVSFIILIAIFVVSYVLFFNTKDLVKQTEEREELIMDEAGWEKILSEYPDFRDGHLNLSNTQYRLGERENAIQSVYKALEIDPNYEKAKEFERFILGN